MFESYFGFTKTPFTKDIAPAQLFECAGRQEVLARLTYVVKEKSIGVLTGEIGAGKSVALRALGSNLDESRNTVAYFFGLAGIRGFYNELVSTLGATPCFFKPQLIAQARDLISQETKEKRKTLVVMVDEAHKLDVEILEELRLLTNSAMDSTSPFALILSGQPPLAQKLRLSQLGALSQRVAIRCQLNGLGHDETAQYVRHHLSVAGRNDTVFSDDALSLVHNASGGIPRRINNLCSQSLIAGYLERKSVIDEATVKRAVAEVGGD